MSRLRAELPIEFMQGEGAPSPAMKYADVEVVETFYRRWPGRHEHVSYWVTLANGMAVGWNETPCLDGRSP
jgi:hypothetical protein